MVEPIKKAWGGLTDMFSFKGGAGTSGAGARDLTLAAPDADAYTQS